MNIKSLVNKLITKIKSFDSISLFVHENPDFDAIGSAFAFKKFIELNFLNKDVRISGMNDSNNWKLVDFFKRNYLAVDQLFVSRSLGIVFDTANEKRVLTQLISNCKDTILFDHHLPVEDYCNLIIRDTNASSTCEIVGLFIKYLVEKQNYLVNNEILESLYFGILTDTNRFLYDKTSVKTYELMSWMSKYNFDKQMVHNQLYLIDLSDAYINNKLFKLINFYPEKKYATLFLDKNTVDTLGGSQNINGKVYLMANFKEIEIWTLVYYDENLHAYKGSIRSRNYDVNQIAMVFNGGGHKLASGFKLTNFNQTIELEKEIKKVIEHLNE